MDVAPAETVRMKVQTRPVVWLIPGLLLVLGIGVVSVEFSPTGGVHHGHIAVHEPAEAFLACEDAVQQHAVRLRGCVFS